MAGSTAAALNGDCRLGEAAQRTATRTAGTSGGGGGGGGGSALPSAAQQCVGRKQHRTYKPLERCSGRSENIVRRRAYATIVPSELARDKFVTAKVMVCWITVRVLYRIEL